MGLCQGLPSVSMLSEVDDIILARNVITLGGVGIPVCADIGASDFMGKASGGLIILDIC